MSAQLGEVKGVLTNVKDFLDDDTVKDAVTALKAVLPPVEQVIESLIDVVGLIKSPLDAIKDQLGYVTALHDLLENIETLLNTAKGLAPSQVETINDALAIVQTLKEIPDTDEITEILNLIGAADVPDSILGILNSSPYKD